MTYAAARTAVVFAAMALVAAGCAANTGDTPTTPSSSTDAATPWDPCTRIPDKVITKAGLDPSTKDANAAGAQYDGWKTCRWQPAGHAATGPTSYYVALLSTDTKSMSAVRNDPQETQLTDITIEGRPALQSRFGHDADSQFSCDITFATSNKGIVDIAVDGSTVTEFTKPVCDMAKQTAISLLSALPQ